MKLDARALDERRFDDDQLAALFRAIQVNDVIAPAGPLPAAPTLNYAQATLIDGFRLSRQLWRQGFDIAALTDLAVTLGRGRGLDPGARQQFKDIRAKFKHLRFAFVLYAGEHRCPVALKAITTALGHLQDAFKRGDASATRRYAGIVRLLLTAVPQRLVRREVDRLVPTDTAGFHRFVLAQMATLRALLALPALDGHQFHAARKIVSRQVSFHDDMRTLSSRPEHVMLARYLGAINGLMGAAHDELVLRRANRAPTATILSSDVRARLTALTAWYAQPG